MGLKNTKCDHCGATFEYEPLVYEGKEFPAPRWCSEDCEQASQEASERAANDQAKTYRHAEWERLCPTLFRQTDIQHPDFPTEKAQRILRWEFGPRGLLMHGVTGKCKTRVLYLLLGKLFVEKGREIAVFPPGQLEVDMLEAYERSRYAGFYRKLARVDVLAVDDLGKDKFTDRYESLIFNLFNERFAHCRPVLLTTNFTGIPASGRQPGVTHLEDRFKDQDKAIPFVRRLREFCEPVAF